MEKDIKYIACPNCEASLHIEVDLHADGYAPLLVECEDCGYVWSIGLSSGS